MPARPVVPGTNGPGSIPILLPMKVERERNTLSVIASRVGRAITPPPCHSLASPLSPLREFQPTLRVDEPRAGHDGSACADLSASRAANITRKARTNSRDQRGPVQLVRGGSPLPAARTARLRAPTYDRRLLEWSVGKKICGSLSRSASLSSHSDHSILMLSIYMFPFQPEVTMNRSRTKLAVISDALRVGIWFKYSSEISKSSCIQPNGPVVWGYA